MSARELRERAWKQNIGVDRLSTTAGNSSREPERHVRAFKQTYVMKPRPVRNKLNALVAVAQGAEVPEMDAVLSNVSRVQ